MKDYSHLLGRQEHTFNWKGIDNALIGRRVLVTGAGGTIGSSLVHYLLDTGVEFVGAVGHSELPIFNLWESLPDKSRADKAIHDIGDTAAMHCLISDWAPDLILHAAAHKHVGLMEGQAETAFRNNTEATRNLAHVALQSGSVRRFVFISTDKAAQPTSVMGASKRLAEAILRKDFYPFATSCRFGNVLGSSGSLIEIVERKLARGETITINDPGMRRFFITAKEAVGLVLTAGLLEEGALYSLDMGGLVSIMHVLAKLCPPDTKFEFGNPGSGEKLDEAILGRDEYFRDTDTPAVREIVTPVIPRLEEALARVRERPETIVEEARNL